MNSPRTCYILAATCFAPLLTGVSLAGAQIDPLSGIEYVAIGAPGNQPWTGNAPFPYQNMTFGRGGVAYEYGIGRFEVNTEQWTEFYNAAFDRPRDDWIPWVVPPTQTIWGAVPTAPATPGGLRWRVPVGNEMRAVGNISWRVAAIYCNWLHNGKSNDRAAFLNGAYDVSTFGGGALEFTDQATHNAGARYWIPTWDEWLKAAHYDPHKNGPGQGGWWMYSNGTDTPPVPGPPAVGEANFGFVNGTQFTIPLGAYPETQTPWGLLDVSGATAEWTEGLIFGGQGTRYRVYEGSYWASSSGYFISDSIFAVGGGTFPTDDTFSQGFRIAMAVPSPHSAFVLASALSLSALRRRRNQRDEVDANAGLCGDGSVARPFTAPLPCHGLSPLWAKDRALVNRTAANAREHSIHSLPMRRSSTSCATDRRPPRARPTPNHRRRSVPRRTRRVVRQTADLSPPSPSHPVTDPPSNHPTGAWPGHSYLPSRATAFRRFGRKTVRWSTEPRRKPARTPTTAYPPPLRASASPR